MSNGIVYEVAGGLTGVDHEPICELHGLGTGSSKLSRDDHFATLGSRLHDEAEDTVARPVQENTRVRDFQGDPIKEPQIRTSGRQDRQAVCFSDSRTER